MNSTSAINGWRVMWLLVTFDCPVLTKVQRRDATQFRKTLLENNFTMHQYSCYLKHFPTLSAAETRMNALRGGIPEEGHVTFFFLTDKQYGMIRDFYGFHLGAPEMPSHDQLQLF